MGLEVTLPVHKSPPLDPILSQPDESSPHNQALYFKIYFHISLPSTSKTPKLFVEVIGIEMEKVT